MRNGSKTEQLNIKLLTAVIALTVILSFAYLGVAFAAYTHNRSAQRTFGNYEGLGALFSSNYLLPEEGEGSRNIRVIYVGSVSINPETGISICNYEQKSPGRFFEGEITYAVSASLKTKSGNNFVDITNATMDSVVKNYTVTIKSGTETIELSRNNTSDSFQSATLLGEVANSDTYTVKFSGGEGDRFTPDLYVEISATPSNPDNLPTLSGVFHADVRNDADDLSWNGVFSDNKTVDPRLYGAYNYSISGVGVGTLTLKWDATKLSLNPDSLKTLTGHYTETYLDENDQVVEVVQIDSANSNVKYITFEVDSAINSRYDVQFFKTGNFPVLEGDVDAKWQTLETLVISTFTDNSQED